MRMQYICRLSNSIYMGDIAMTYPGPFARNYALALLPRARYTLIFPIVQVKVVQPRFVFLGFLLISSIPLVRHQMQDSM